MVGITHGLRDGVISVFFQVKLAQSVMEWSYQNHVYIYSLVCNSYNSSRDEVIYIVSERNWHKAQRSYQNHVYWAIQAGLLTPLTFARHRLSPLAAFTSGAYFPHNGRR